MAAAVPEYLTGVDLEELIGSAEVDRLFDDDGDGIRDSSKLNSVLAQAEAIALSRMLRGWTRTQVVTLAQNDPAFTAMVAWVACELAAERRGDFLSSDGWGRYRAQYDRAIQYFEALSKSQIHSKGEGAAGTNKQTGGRLQPRLSNGDPVPPIFGPNKNSPFGPGGF